MRSDDTLFALDRATRAIAGELDLDRVLQLIVDSVRELVGAEYAALGIVDAGGRIERFITSGISAELRARIGPYPIGRGLLGTIIRDGRAQRVAILAQHPDAFGFPPEHPPMRSFLGVPVRVGGEAVGNFYLTDKREAPEFGVEDQELVEMFAVHAAIAIQNAQLHMEVQRHAIIDERLRISRDLHDGVIQSIYAVSLSLEETLEIVESDDGEAQARIDRAIDRLHTTISDIRQFIVGLGSDPDLGLAGALEEMAGELLAGTGIDVTLDLSGATEADRRLLPEAGHELLQIAREAVSNVARHSGADRATISLSVQDDQATLRVEDDGVGFDTGKRHGSGHFGLANLRGRAASLAGSLTVDSAPNVGTRIIVSLPLAPTESPS